MSESLLVWFDQFKLERIFRAENDCANALAKLASIKLSIRNRSIICSVMLALTIEKNESMCVDKKVSWMDPIKAYLEVGTLSKDKKEANKV